jgi:predicted NBD/HSP70 family sugar kinase
MRTREELIGLIASLPPAAVKIFAEVVKSDGPISRSTLSELTSLSLAAVTKTVVPLIDAGLVGEIDLSRTATAPGRPVVPLAPVAESLAFIGIKITASAIYGAMVDFRGKDLSLPVSRPLANTDVGTIVSAIQSTVTSLCGVRPDLSPLVVGVGIAVSGDVDSVEGVVNESPLLNWYGIPLRERLEEVLRLPVLIDNDVRSLMFYEQWFGAARGAGSIALVTIGAGIGSGILIDGKVQTGSLGVVGEIGHLPLGPSELVCHCGRRGCVESVASFDGIMAAWSRGGGSETDTIQSVIQAARAGDGRAVESFAVAGHFVGLAIASLVNLLGPDLVLISGEGVENADLYMGELTSAFDAHAFGRASQTPLLLSRKSFEDWARAAGSTVIRGLVLNAAGFTTSERFRTVPA